MLKSSLRLALLCLFVASGSPAPGLAGEPANQPARVIFAGGCFWCMEEAYERVPGVIAAVSGYTGGNVKNPTYEQVSSGRTGHFEAVQVEYDPQKVTYEKLLDIFWHNIDPTQGDGQFCDHGPQYRSAIFYQNDQQKRLADASKAAVAKGKPFKGEIVTAILPAAEFYPAEDYHQDFYKKNPARYKFYKTGCGREARLTQLWGRSGH
jgi:peptide-methionine (S)-S-oxide reductase